MGNQQGGGAGDQRSRSPSPPPQRDVDLKQTDKVRAQLMLTSPLVPPTKQCDTKMRLTPASLARSSCG